MRKKCIPSVKDLERARFSPYMGLLGSHAQCKHGCEEYRLSLRQVMEPYDAEDRKPCLVCAPGKRQCGAHRRNPGSAEGKEVRRERQGHQGERVGRTRGQGQGQGSNEPSRLGIGREKRVPRRGGKRGDTVS